MVEPAAPLVKAEDMAKKYGDFIALHPLNVEVHAGEFFGVFGPNGAGNQRSSNSSRANCVQAKAGLKFSVLTQFPTLKKSKPTSVLYLNPNHHLRS